MSESPKLCSDLNPVRNQPAGTTRLSSLPQPQAGQRTKRCKRCMPSVGVMLDWIFELSLGLGTCQS